MTTPDPKPPPSALDEWLEHHEGMCNGITEEACTCGRDAATAELASLRSDLAAAQKERDALRVEKAELEKVVKRARGQLDAGLAALHGSIEVNSQS